MTTDKREAHSFIVLKHKNDSSKQYIFDIENPLKYKTTENSEPILGIALYPMTEEEYKSFIDGKNMKLKSVYEKFGMSLVGTERMYGDDNEKLSIENDEI